MDKTEAYIAPIILGKGKCTMTPNPVKDMNATTDYAAGQAQSEVEQLRSQIKDLTDKYGSMAQGKLSDVKQKVSQNMGDIEEQIRDKPVQATLVAAFVGFLIGALLTR
jgi:ElaB/YqjD/DUF883 family membrane-anchored ribosome-binding protein